ncbi:CRISPR-associated endonuclease/helicase Cas3 [Castellaniella caeni]
MDANGVHGCGFEAQRYAALALGAVAEDLDAVAEKVLGLLRGGGCGAVILNTVDRAQNLYQTLARQLDRDVPILLFHARFPADQRAAIERQVLNLFGPEGQRPKAAILVATQVAEQSLDLDFDFMLSDLAPVDLLLQRAGRLHRHSRARPELHACACLWVAGLLPDRLPEMKATRWLYVYEPLILLRTWQLLKHLPLLQLPSDIDRYVQRVYDAPKDIPEELEALVSQEMMGDLQGKYLGKNQFQHQLARNIVLDPRSEDPFMVYAERLLAEEAGEGSGIEAKTRLGPESVAVIPLWHGPSGWKTSPEGAPFDPLVPLRDAQAKMLYSRQIKVSRQNLVKFFKNCEVPACFAEHPWLRDVYPLLLDAQGCAESGLGIRLDEELGLVYDTSPDHPH